MKKIKIKKNKVEEIEIIEKSISKVEEVVIPKCKLNIEPFSDEEEEFLDYLVKTFVKKKELSKDN
jgi:hypothetical protein